MKLVIISLAVVLLVGCKAKFEINQELADEADTSQSSENNEYLTKMVKYGIDSKTGICFAFMKNGDGFGSAAGLTEVSCDNVPADVIKQD